MLIYTQICPITYTYTHRNSFSSLYWLWQDPYLMKHQCKKQRKKSTVCSCMQKHTPQGLQQSELDKLISQYRHEEQF